MRSTDDGVRGNGTDERCSTPPIIGRDPCMLRLWSGVQALCQRDCTVLVCGESGSGKELAARHLHNASIRREQPFVIADCTTLHGTLMESQIFGHLKGAFTGAWHDTTGLFRAADGGTLFLDEVGDLPLEMQAKLLRCVQERAVVPVGGTAPIPADVRIIAATHRDLRDMVKRKLFREDLYYRLDVVRLEVPPLRARRADIPLLAEHFLNVQAEMYHEAPKRLADEALRVLLAYDWPGNIRELRNALEHGYVMARGDCVAVADLPETLRRPNVAAVARHNGQGKKVVPLEAAERTMIKRALRAAGGNQTLAAAMLGIERHRLARKIRRHGLKSVLRLAAQ